MPDVQPTVAQLQRAREIAAVRLIEIETELRVATGVVALTDRQYQSAGLAAVKAQGPGGSRGSMLAAQNVLTDAERGLTEARVLANQLTQERAQLKFRTEFLDMRIGQANDMLVAPTRR